MSDNLKKILKKMFTYSGIEYSDELVRQEGWFLKYTWKEGEEEDFTEWLIKFLIKTKGDGVASYPVRNKKHAILVADDFNVTYGWKTKQ